MEIELDNETEIEALSGKSEEEIMEILEGKSKEEIDKMVTDHLDAKVTDVDYYFTDIENTYEDKNCKLIAISSKFDGEEAPELGLTVLTKNKNDYFDSEIDDQYDPHFTPVAFGFPEEYEFDQGIIENYLVDKVINEIKTNFNNSTEIEALSGKSEEEIEKILEGKTSEEIYEMVTDHLDAKVTDISYSHQDFEDSYNSGESASYYYISCKYDGEDAPELGVNVVLKTTYREGNLHRTIETDSEYDGDFDFEAFGIPEYRIFYDEQVETYLLGKIKDDLSANVSLYNETHFKGLLGDDPADPEALQALSEALKIDDPALFSETVRNIMNENWSSDNFYKRSQALSYLIESEATADEMREAISEGYDFDELDDDNEPSI